MPLVRVGRNGFVWTDYVLSRGSCILCNKRLPNISGSKCNFLELFLISYSNRFQPSVGLVMAVFKPAFPAVLPNHHNVLEGFIATKCSIGIAPPTFLEVMWTVLGLLLSHSRLYEGMVSQPRFRKLPQDHEGSCMSLCMNQHEDVQLITPW
jgi:hypothetical protein